MDKVFLGIKFHADYRNRLATDFTPKQEDPT